MLYGVLLFIALAAAPCIYLAMAFRSKAPSSFEEYHYAGRQIQPGGFISSTVAYALQIAVLSLFASWGYEYGIWTIWVAVFWAAGYFSLAGLVRSGATDRFLRQNTLGTIHQFLAARSDFRLVAWLAALVSLLGIAGPAMYEAFFTAHVTTRMIADLGAPASGARFITQYTALFFWVFLALAAAYMLYGGFRAIVHTDAVQLSIGYLAFSAALALLLVRNASNGHPTASLILLALLVALSLVVGLYWLLAVPSQRRLRRLPLLLANGALPLAIYVVGLLWVLVKSRGFEPSSVTQFFTEQKLQHPLSLGAVTLLNLLIANGLYQFVDIGQWQRLGCVSYDRARPQESRDAIARYLRRIAVISSASWIVAVVFGMSLRYVSEDMSHHAFDELASFMLSAQASPVVFDKAVALLLILACGAVMFSTLDSLVASVAFTAHNDILLGFRGIWQRVGVARFTTAALLIVCGLLYLFANARVPTFAEILYASWSMQVGLFWVIVLAFTSKPMSRWAAVLSILAGMAGALLPLFVGEPLTTYSYGAIFAFAGAGAVAVLATVLPGGRTQMEGGIR